MTIEGVVMVPGQAILTEVRQTWRFLPLRLHPSFPVRHHCSCRRLMRKRGKTVKLRERAIPEQAPLRLVSFPLTRAPDR